MSKYELSITKDYAQDWTILEVRGFNKIVAIKYKEDEYNGN